MDGIYSSIILENSPYHIKWIVDMDNEIQDHILPETRVVTTDRYMQLLVLTARL